MATTAHYIHTAQIHYLRASISYNTPNAANGIPIGKVPAGSIMLPGVANVEAAFNAGTTNTVNVGTTPTGGEVAASAAIAPTATGGKAITTSQGMRVAADTEVYISYVQSGTAASAGVVHIVIPYVPQMLA